MFNLPMSDYALELRPLRIENKKTRPKKRNARIELIYTQDTNEGDMYIYIYIYVPCRSSTVLKTGFVKRLFLSANHCFPIFSPSLCFNLGHVLQGCFVVASGGHGLALSVLARGLR